MRTIGNTPVDGEVRAVASGALANGDTVVVNSDGTVSVVDGASVSPAVGSPVVGANEVVNEVVATYDSTNGKVIMAYRKGSNNYLAAVVGTVSGTSTSFGSISSTAYYAEVQAITYDSTNEKVVIFYKNGSNHLYAALGTVSGTSISLSTGTAVNTGTTYAVSAAFDANASKVVVAYRDGGNSSYGTARVGTVSGSSISFGSEVVFESSTTSETAMAYDSAAQKIIIVYKDGSSNSQGKVGTISGTSISFGSATQATTDNAFYTSLVYDSGNNKVVYFYAAAAIVGTVSGTSISFGSKTNFNSSALYISAAYDPNAEVITVSYEDTANSEYGTFINGTVSGTSISFGSETVYETAAVRDTATVFDSTNNVVVTLYKDEGNSGKGTAVVIQNAYTSTNLTSENFIGFANGAAADGTSAVVQTGCSINDAQSGLTAGQDYYVQTDGTLSETPADPSVFAGTAVSATKLIVKG